jgi:toxin ParE1/3/4
MPERLEQHPYVREDLIEIHQHIASDNPEAADRVIEAIRALFSRLKHHPLCGSRYHHPEIQDLRKALVPEFRNYIVFYRRLPGVIRVLHVLHGARDLPRVLRDEARR